MKEFVIETRVPMRCAHYSQLAFSREFDDFVMQRYGVASLDEHVDDSVISRAALDARAQANHAGAEWAAWRSAAGASATATVADLLADACSAPNDVDASHVTARRFRVTPRSAVASALSWALWMAGAKGGVHYDAVQFRVAPLGCGTPHVRSFLSAEALPAFAVEVYTTFEEAGVDETLQRVRLAVTTGSTTFDGAVGALLNALVAPDFARMADAAAAWQRGDGGAGGDGGDGGDGGERAPRA